MPRGGTSPYALKGTYTEPREAMPANNSAPADPWAAWGPSQAVPNYDVRLQYQQGPGTWGQGGSPGANNAMNWGKFNSYWGNNPAAQNLLNTPVTPMQMDPAGGVFTAGNSGWAKTLNTPLRPQTPAQQQQPPLLPPQPQPPQYQVGGTTANPYAGTQYSGQQPITQQQLQQQLAPHAMASVQNGGGTMSAYQQPQQGYTPQSQMGMGNPQMMQAFQQLIRSNPQILYGLMAMMGMR